MESTTTVTMVDGVRIVVPDSLNLMTPYVLIEQEDWFEDEIKFLRRLLQPGQEVIDVGANYGVYALSMARTVGPTGRVWAFEPASSTVRFLAESVAANGYTQVVLEESALSNTRGTAQLSLNKNSELNALVHGTHSTSASETVPVSTLDECLERHGWRDIAFMKIDAEGEEANILKGGGRFFAERSPLVQFEVKAGLELHMELVEQFAALGYDSYRLVPGLDLLTPFRAKSTPDGYLVNLFCCKLDRAERLFAHGHLLNPKAQFPVTTPTRFTRIREKFKYRHSYDWRHTIAKLPYGTQLANLWKRTMAAGKGSTEVDEALSLYALSRDSSRSPAARFEALEASFGLLKVLNERQSTCPRSASLARVARDYGARSVAVSALQRLCDAILKHGQVDLDEPFLAPSERFDSIPPGESIGNWVLAAALEEFERLSSLSSFYTGDSGRERLEIIGALGFGSAEMERRSDLLQKRFGLRLP